MKTHLKIAAAAMMTFLSACGVTSKPEGAYDVVAPKTAPVKTITSFTESLACMDRLFLAYGMRGIVITSAGVPDATQRIGGGTREMLISAFSRMSVNSRAFSFVDYDPTQFDVVELHNLVGFSEDFQIPKFYIRGAITQLDEGVLAENMSGGLALDVFDLSASKDQIVSIISLDLNMVRLRTRQVLPGISANNSIAVARKGLAGDTGATIGKAGLVFNIAMNKSEGKHQAVRTLMELSIIELAGKLTQVPYWRCLQIEAANPEMVAQQQSWYAGMSEQERVTFIQRALSGQGYYRGPVHGLMDGATHQAIGQYQANNGLIANGNINFHLYQSLLAQDLVLQGRPQAVQYQDAALPTAAPQPAPQVPLTLQVSEAKGPGAAYAVGENLRMTLAANRNAFLYCYYQDHAGNVARIFPNRYQPNALVTPGQNLTVPSVDAGFAIVFEQPGALEEVACYGSEREIGLLLPDNLKVADLTPLPVASLNDLGSAFLKIDQGGLASARLRLPVIQ